MPHGGRRFIRRGTGGCGVFENPAFDARDAQPIWHPIPPSTLRLTPERETAFAPAFSLWHLAGRKSIVHDGRHLSVVCARGPDRFRIGLLDGLEDGQPFALTIPASASAQAGITAAVRLFASMTPRSPRAPRLKPKRPSRTVLFHARALQALDGALAGASRREIAHALFGPERVARSWHPGSDLRSHMRHLIRRATALMQGEYRALVTRLSAR